MTEYVNYKTAPIGAVAADEYTTLVKNDKGWYYLEGREQEGGNRRLRSAPGAAPDGVIRRRERANTNETPGAHERSARRRRIPSGANSRRAFP